MTAPTVDETTWDQVDFNTRPTCSLYVIEFGVREHPRCTKPAEWAGPASCCGKTVLACQQHHTMYVKGWTYYCETCQIRRVTIKWVKL
jgi:hypothetical protein